MNQELENKYIAMCCDKTTKNSFEELANSYHILAIWFNKELSEKYNCIMLNMIKTNYTMQHIRETVAGIRCAVINTEIKYDVIIDFILRHMNDAFPTQNLESKDFLYIMPGLILPPPSFQYYEKDDTMNISKFNKHHLLAPLLENHPEIVDIVGKNLLTQSDTEIREQGGPWYDYIPWKHMISKYPPHLLAEFIGGNTYKFQAMAIDSPFLRYYPMLSQLEYVPVS